MTTIYGRKNLSWVKNSLWDEDNYICAVVPHETHKLMFWIKWPDGTQSEDFYNLTRAKDNAVKYTLGLVNEDRKK